MEHRTDSLNRCLFLCAKLNQTSLVLLSPLRANAAERKAECRSGRLSASERHAVAVAPAPERQRAEEAETRLGHPTHQRAGKFPRALPTAARAGKWRPLPAGWGGSRLSAPSPPGSGKSVGGACGGWGARACPGAGARDGLHLASKPFQ